GGAAVPRSSLSPVFHEPVLSRDDPGEIRRDNGGAHPGNDLAPDRARARDSLSVMDSRARIYVAGRTTFVGGALVKRLEAAGFTGIVPDDPDVADRASVEQFFERTRPEYVFVAAGRTAGIEGNQRFPADLMTDNLLVASNLIPASWRGGARKLQYLASSCIYPTIAPQPLHPSSLWTGPLEPTSAAYAVAKLAGVTLCDAYRR